MNLIPRNHCIFSSNHLLEPIQSFRNFPVFMGCVEAAKDEDIFCDMNWFICKNCGSIQLNPLIPSSILYPEQHNEVVGKIWMDHHEQFSNFISKYHPQHVLEIGAAHGILAKSYLSYLPNTHWTIVEPNPKLIDHLNVDLIQKPFDKNFKFTKPLDAIVHSHVFEHIFEPCDFLNCISQMIPSNKFLLFSVPNLEFLLKSYFTNALNFEHTFYLDEVFIEHLLHRFGFSILEKKYYGKHSIFYASQKTKDIQIIPVPNRYQANMGLFQNFIRYFENEIERLNHLIHQSHDPIFIFGGHIFTQFLLAFGLDDRKIISILDNGKNKIGKRLYGTHLRVLSPKTLYGIPKAHVILKAAGYNAEIKEDILKNINPHIDFWE